MGSVSEPIKQTIMYMMSARQIWLYLERRFSITNGSLKYKLNKDLYETKQGASSINEYYTTMKSIWEELDSLDQLPAITEPSEDVIKFLEACEKQKEEKRLFQFLNGLDEAYGPLRSQILMITPLPTMDFACSSLQQEESQRNILNPLKPSMESSAMYNKGIGESVICSACGIKGHMRDKCWTVIGYPKWHSKYKAPYKGKETFTRMNNSSQNWSRHKNSKMAASAQESSILAEGSEISVGQLEQLLRSLPGNHKFAVNNAQSEEDVENSFGGFAGMVSCFYANETMTEWIIDSGASDHMTGNVSCVKDPRVATVEYRINLPNGGTSKITHCGSVMLKNGLTLRDVLVVPEFKHSLLSVKKLIDSENYKVKFYVGWCIIVHNDTHMVKGLGKSRDGLYYLVDENVNSLVGDLNHVVHNSMNVTHGCIGSEKMNENLLWHLRLGHAPFPKLHTLGVLKKSPQAVDHLCVTCPMGKLTK